MINKIPTNLEELTELDLKVLKTIKRAGEKHLKYFYSTMQAFKWPKLRLKSFDTLAYERVLPRIERILREHGDTELI